MLAVWQTFKQAHALVLRIAESDSAFRAFVDGVKPAELPKLDEVVSLLVVAEGEGAVLKRLEDGSLNTAVHTMPETAITIARDTKSVGAALDWYRIAGKRIDEVAANDIHRHAAPADFSSASLSRVLALADRTSIKRIAAIPATARDTLLSLDAQRLASLVKSLSEDELTTLSSYLAGLQPGPRERVLTAVADNPGRMQVLASPGVRDAIIASADQSAAAEMMLRPAAGLAPSVFAGDVVMAWEGRISPLLLWYRHPAPVAVSAVLMLVVLGWLMRLFRRRKPTAAPPAAV